MEDGEWIERLFRSANELIAEHAAARGVTGPVPILCECSDPSCLESLEVTLAEFHAVRAHANRFVVGRGHETPDEAVVEENDRFSVVQKELVN
jgi:hypothetical protein